MARLAHSPGINGAFSFRGETWQLENGEFTVADDELAHAIVDAYPAKIRFVDSSDGESTAEYPTNDDGEPLCVGKDDGQCSRVVDEAGLSCWQH